MHPCVLAGTRDNTVNSTQVQMRTRVEEITAQHGGRMRGLQRVIKPSPGTALVDRAPLKTEESDRVPNTEHEL